MEKRHTTRIEDKAYALIGLLNIDFQIMYGEGDRAWTRGIEQIAMQKGYLSWIIGTSESRHLNCKYLVPRPIRDD
ncbi:hypothetical protein BGW37DRAFT_431401 [Umbelopsis sp. PMI_123]|nr:hypothetical protein BGW37DRAFT_431401 [Umbelopsis sp. PMI_123]